MMPFDHFVLQINSKHVIQITAGFFINLMDAWMDAIRSLCFKQMMNAFGIINHYVRFYILNFSESAGYPKGNVFSNMLLNLNQL